MTDAREKANEQAEALKRRVIAEVDLEIKRRSLQVRQEVILDIIDRSQKKLAAAVSEENYRAVLVNWMVDAAVGLDVPSARVNASPKELALIDEKLLAEVMGKIQTLIGAPITLTMSQDQPLDSQGIVLTSQDGRIAYNYQVKTRLSRKQRVINRLIHDALFAGD